MKKKLCKISIFIILIIAGLFLVFNIFFVSRKKVVTNIEIIKYECVQTSFDKKSYVYNKSSGFKTIESSYPPVYLVTANSQEDGEIQFMYGSNIFLLEFPLDKKHKVEYTVKKIFNKTKIVNLKKIESF